MHKSQEALVAARRRAHPWYAEYDELATQWNKRLAELKTLNVDIEKMAAKARAETSVSDVLGLVRAIMGQPDILAIYQGYVTREKVNPEAQFLPDEVTILHAFRTWFLFRIEKFPDTLPYIHAAEVVLQFLRKKIPSVDGDEAKAIIRRSGA